MKKWLALIALALGACAFLALEPPAKDTIEQPAHTGRYQLVPAATDFMSASGPGTAHIVFKIDTDTGRTWIFYSSTNEVNWREISNK